MSTLSLRHTFMHLCHALLDLTHQESVAIQTGQWEKMEPLLRHKTRILERIENMNLKNFDVEEDEAAIAVKLTIEEMLGRMTAMEAENRRLIEEKMSGIQGEIKGVKDQWKAQGAYLGGQA